jgi:N-acetylneuraminic acid mutarotase
MELPATALSVDFDMQSHDEAAYPNQTRRSEMKSLGWFRAFAGATLLTAMGASGGQAGTCTLPGWTAANQVGTDVYGAAVTSAGGFIYAASGFSFSIGGWVNQFRRYDPGTNTWIGLTPVPTAREMASLAYDAAGGRLFFFGGVNAGGAQSLVHVYTIATNTWAAGPALPAPRTQMGSGVIGGLIYLVGGFSSINITPATTHDQNWEFNPATGTYTPRAVLPQILGGAGSAVSGGRLYIMGGRDPVNTQRDSNYEYDPVGNTWAVRAVLQTAVNVPGSTALSGQAGCNEDIILVGGGNPLLKNSVSPGSSRAAETTNITQLYNVPTNSWSPGPPLPTGRSFIGAAQADDTLVAVGGYTGLTSVATVDRIQGPPLPVELQDFRVE